MTLPSLLTSLLLAAGPATPPAPPPPPPGAPPQAAAMAPPATVIQDPAALALVKKMSERLQRARTFTFRARTVLELPVPGGALATFVNETSAAVRRPDGLAGSRSGELPDFRFAYDGKSLTFYAPGSGSWATAAAPPTLDAMISDAAERAGINLPWDELLVADPYAAITKDLGLALHVASATIGGKKVDHVLLTGPGLQLEYWIDATTALPARATVTYTDEPLRPHFTAEFSDWKVDTTLPASTFALPRPNGAKQVELREAAAAFR